MCPGGKVPVEEGIFFVVVVDVVSDVYSGKKLHGRVLPGEKSFTLGRLSNSEISKTAKEHLCEQNHPGADQAPPTHLSLFLYSHLREKLAVLLVV